MKAVILAGGMGTRISEESVARPKPMIEIGGKPILWHIMKIYSSHGINDFVICLGYKGYVIKEYFSNYFLHQSNVTFDLRAGDLTAGELDVALVGGTHPDPDALAAAGATWCFPEILPGATAADAMSEAATPPG